jgi:hypothetical protein
VEDPLSIAEFGTDPLSTLSFALKIRFERYDQILTLFFYRIDRKLAPGIRCTVKMDPAVYGKPGAIKGTVVSPSAPREDDGTFWGYTTRLASSINDVFDGCPFEGGYDLKIGTSERGDKSVDEKNFKVPKFEHSLIVFGGVAGIEECVDADETIKLPGSESRQLFDMW